MIPAAGTGPAIKPADGAAGETPTRAEAQRLAKLAGEFESMLLVQMLREMRKSGRWEDEQSDTEGYGAATLFDTLDIEMASYIARSQNFGLEQSLVKEVSGTSGSGAPVNALPLNLPSLELPVSQGSLNAPDEHDHGTVQEREGVDHLATRVTTSPFGWRRDPFSGAATYHRGVDLRAAYGEPIGAADAGTVVFAGEQGGYGQTVVVEHAGGVRTRYAHLSSVTTQAGATVKAGDSIGLAGRSGRATGTHLHFEVTQDGRPIDPQTYSPGGLKPERVIADWGGGTGLTLPGGPTK